MHSHSMQKLERLYTNKLQYLQEVTEEKFVWCTQFLTKFLIKLSTICL